MHKIWDSDGLFTAVRGRNLLRRRKYWHEATHEWQGVGQKNAGLIIESAHPLEKLPSVS
jgi:hypothetical protein